MSELDHCKRDPRDCRGESYCACQCDKCKIAYWANSAERLRAQLATALRERVSLQEAFCQSQSKLATAVEALEWAIGSVPFESSLAGLIRNALSAIRGTEGK